MILTKSVKVHLINSNISHYKQYYTDIKSGDYNDKKLKSLETCMNKYGVEYPTQNEDIRNKIKVSFINKYIG